MATNGSAGSSEGVRLSISQESYGTANEIISRVIRGRLPEIQLSDFEDLKQTVLIKIVQRLRESDADENNTSDSSDSSDSSNSSNSSDSSNSSNSSIRDFSGYVAGVAHNTCNDFLRTKSPVRTLLKQSLRDLFTRHPELGIWKEGQFTLCGFSEWTGDSLPIGTDEKVTNLYELIELSDRLFLTENSGSKKVSTTFVFNLLNLLGGPIPLDDLANLVTHFQGCAEYTFTSFDDESLSTERSTSETITSYGADIDARSLLRRIWELLQQRSLNQRRTFLYTFTDENGDSLLRRMFEDRVATVTELIENLEISAEHLLELVKRTPLDSAAAADELSESKTKVNKWRHRICEYLLGKLKEVKK